MEIHCVIVLFLGVFSSTISSTVEATSDLNPEETAYEIEFMKQRMKEMEDRVSVLENRETGDLEQRIKHEILAAVQHAETSLTFRLESIQKNLTRSMRMLEEIQTRSGVLEDIPEMKKTLTNHSIQLDRLNQHLSCVKSSGDKVVTPVDVEASGPPSDTRDAPDLCQDGSIDTVTRTQNGSTYVFKGDFYWKIVSKGIADGYPRKISDDWDGLEGNLDASLTLWSGRTFFFKGGRYWSFTNKKMDSGYPKLLRNRILDNLDAACVWKGDGIPYIFKGDQYWQIDADKEPPVIVGSPRPSSEWGVIPQGGVDAAFQWENFRTYFFKGDKYYRYEGYYDEIPPYPRSTSVWWFGCKADPDTEYPRDATRMLK